MSGQTVICAGRIYCDLVFSGLDGPPEPGREVFAEALALRAGGGAYITAAYLSALGGQAGLMGVLPAPPFGHCVTREMAQNRVRSHCSAAGAGDPQITVALARGGDRSFITRRVGAALAGADLPPARHLHIGELTTALEHPELIAKARARAMSVSLDCSWDARALADPGTAEVIASVDIFLPNAAEMEALAASGIAVAPRLMSVIKRGAEGATLIGAEGARIEAAAIPTTPVDTTGAGDAFNAGFLAAWLDGAEMAEALAQANRCGSIAVGRIGGAGALPDLRLPETGISGQARRQV